MEIYEVDGGQFLHKLSQRKCCISSDGFSLILLYCPACLTSHILACDCHCIGRSSVYYAVCIGYRCRKLAKGSVLDCTVLCKANESSVLIFSYNIKYLVIKTNSVGCSESLFTYCVLLCSIIYSAVLDNTRVHVP